MFRDRSRVPAIAASEGQAIVLPAGARDLSEDEPGEAAGSSVPVSYDCRVPRVQRMGLRTA